ncbi:epoxide hydrolase 4-like isoform X2 [Cloeon dipterum]|uniref:epoxide hydrolase 4-like isoform X2 n=1 Tax=Cloeon dipterum TaxID=197152 RepID=UPI00321FD0DC
MLLSDTPPIRREIMFRTSQVIKERLLQNTHEFAEKKEPVVVVPVLERLEFYAVGALWAVLALFQLIAFWFWNAKKYFARKKRDKPAPNCLTDSSLGTHSYIKLKGAKLHYVEAGDRNQPLMICLHGFLDCWIGWRFQIPTMAQNFRIVAVDLKGYGDSEKPLSRGKYEIEQVVEELAEFITAVAADRKDQKCVLVGHDVGALVGWFLVYSHPELISRFVSISCPHPNVFWNLLESTALFNKKMVQQSQFPEIMERCLMLNDLAIIDSVHSHVQAHPNSGVVSKETYKFVFSRKMDWTGALNYYRTLWKARINPELVGKLDVPLLLIVGDREQSFSLETAIRSTELEPKLVVRVVNGAGHAPHQEAVPQVNKLLLTFLAVTDSQPGFRISAMKSSIVEPEQNGIVNRMIGALNSTYSFGNQMLEQVTRKKDPLALPYRTRGCNTQLAPR